MYRKGIIISYSHSNKIGYIKDSNGQKIRFANGTGVQLKLNDLVKYNIAFIDNTYVAVNVHVIKSKPNSTLAVVTKIKAKKLIFLVSF